MHMHLIFTEGVNGIEVHTTIHVNELIDEAQYENLIIKSSSTTVHLNKL